MIPFAIKRLLLYAYGKIMMKMTGCLFCQIIARERPGALVYEDDRCIAFEDINPKAPVHVLVVPRRHIPSLTDSIEGDEGLLGHLLLVAARVAQDKGIAGSGFRTVINTSAGAGQTIFHLHIHLLGGRALRWPPG
jgi:histidine triad (HIT) family protein